MTCQCIFGGKSLNLVRVVHLFVLSHFVRMAGKVIAKSESIMTLRLGALHKKNFHRSAKRIEWHKMMTSGIVRVGCISQGNGREDAKENALGSVVVGGTILPSRSGSHFPRGCTQCVVCIAFKVSTSVCISERPTAFRARISTNCTTLQRGAGTRIKSQGQQNEIQALAPS